jgi:glutathione S-transferase
MHLLEHPLSCYAQKVKMALREKQLDFTVETPTGLGAGSDTGPLSQANIRAEVPTLIDGDTAVWDSSIILQYLEDKFPQPALLPADPAARARARMIEDVCDTQYEAINWGISEVRWFGRAQGPLAETLHKAATRQTAQIQQWLSEQLGAQDWFGGAAFGLADLSVAPFLNRSDYYKLGPEPGSSLQRWLERVRQRPAIAKTFSSASGSARPSPRPSKNSKPPQQNPATPPSGWPQAASAANIAITGWNG